MKIHILSDLHLECHIPKKPCSEADVVVLAGDIYEGGTQGIEWAARMWQDRPVIYVPGNHEYIGHDYEQARLDMATAASKYDNIHLLDRGRVVVDDVLFVGATLWTDFMYSTPDGDYIKHHLVLKEAVEHMPEYREIMLDGRRLKPLDTIGFFREEHAYIRDVLSAENEDLAKQMGRANIRKKIVVTHHLPSDKSVHPRHARSMLASSYASRIDNTVALADLWIHGHTHESCDYVVNGPEGHASRVVCNPRGYSGKGVPENMHYKPDLVVNI